MNTRELERLSDWDEGELTEVVVALVRRHGRLPDLEQMSECRAGTDLPE
ncbi:MAG: hypothetical protein ACXVWX_09985 [Nocardioides sp.]